MNDGYIQSKQRELNEKLKEIENKQKILDNKTSAMERQIEQYQTVLDEIKKESGKKGELFEEMKTYVEEINKSDKKQIQKQIDNFRKSLRGDFDKLNEFFESYDEDRRSARITMTIAEVQFNQLVRLLQDKKLLVLNEGNFLVNSRSEWFEMLKSDDKLNVDKFLYDENKDYHIDTDLIKKHKKTMKKHFKNYQ